MRKLDSNLDKYTTGGIAVPDQACGLFIQVFPFGFLVDGLSPPASDTYRG